MTAVKTPTWAKLALLVILVLDVWWRCHTIGPLVRDLTGLKLWPVVVGEAEPLDCDEAVFAHIGKGLARGEVLYRDYSDNKPPLCYWLYGLTVRIAGENELAIRLLPIPFVLATITLVWWLAIRLGGPLAGCVAALVLALLSTDPYLYGNGSNMEHYLNLFSVASVAAMVRADRSGPKDRWWLVTAGVMVGLATLVKQVAALHGLIYVIAVIARRDGFRTIVKDLIALAAGFGAILAIAAAVLLVQGAGPDAYRDIVTYGSALATLKVPEPHAPMKLVRWITGNADPDGILPPPFGTTNYLVWWGVGSWPIWLVSVPCLGWMVAGPKSNRGRRLLAAWTLSAWVQVAAPGLFWAHYYLLPTAGLAIAVAVTLRDAWTAKRSRFVAIVGVIMILAAIGKTAQIQVRDYLMVPPEQLTARFKGGGQWIALRSLGREIGRRTEGWDRPSLYVWGWQSPLFPYSGLDGPTRQFFADPLLEDYARGYHRDDSRLIPRVDRIMEDLEARPPSLALVAYPPFPRLRAFLERRYIRSSFAGMNPNSPDGIGFWVERSHYRAFETTGAPRSATAR